MTADTFFKVMIWLQGACAIQHAPMKGMIDILFNELKNIFSEDNTTILQKEKNNFKSIIKRLPVLARVVEILPSD